MRTLSAVLQRFSTAETAFVCGVSHDTLRTWRARGFMPEDRHWHDGYDSLQLCALAIRKVMVDQGESPRDTTRAAPPFAPIVLAEALKARPATEVDDLLVAELLDHDLAGARYLASRNDEPYRLIPDVHSLAALNACSLRLIDLAALGDRIAFLAPRALTG